jgi:DNA-binding GntR family transcriptional regulator
VIAIERLSTAERVADALREEVLSGAIPPGTPLRDGELSARAGVSRTTMREALAHLAREGLLTHTLHRGMEVAQLAPRDVRDIYALRRVLEGAGAQAMLEGAGSLSELEAALAAMAQATARGDWRRVVEADAAFHTAIVAALGSGRLRAAMAGAMRELRLVLSLADRASDDLDEQLRQHQALFAWLRARAPETVTAVMDHLTRAEALVCATLAAGGDARQE